MGFYITKSGKLFGAAVAAWFGTKMLQKYQESQEDPNRIHSLEEMDLPESFKSAMRNAAFCDDKKEFLRVLEHFQITEDPYVRRRLWELSGGKG